MNARKARHGKCLTAQSKSIIVAMLGIIDRAHANVVLAVLLFHGLEQALVDHPRTSPKKLEMHVSSQSRLEIVPDPRVAWS